MDDPLKITWRSIGRHYPDLRGTPDYFLALDRGEQIGFVRLLGRGKDAGSWFWNMWLTSPGPAFPHPTSGTMPTRREAESELATCYVVFRAHHRVKD